MVNKPGLIIDGQIFLNADHIKKMSKYDNDYGSHWIEVFTSDDKNAITYITFKDKIERDEAFDRIIKEVFGDCFEFHKNEKQPFLLYLMLYKQFVHSVQRWTGTRRIFYKLFKN